MRSEPKGTSDEDLIRRSAARDRGAFDALVARHGGALLRFATRRCATDMDAADAVQDGLLAAWRNAGTFRGEASARAWLYQIVLHSCRRRARRRAGEPEHHAPLEAAAELAGTDAPDERVAALQVGAALEQALAALPAAAQEVLLLRDVEGLSGAETAEALSIDLAAMKSRLHRARLELKARVEELLGRALSEELS